MPPIVAKIGRSEAAARAALSHTGTDTGDDEAYRRAFDEAGVIRGDDQDELLDIAAAFATCPLPIGPRVAIVTISGGAGAWLADRMEASGLRVPLLDEATQAEIRKVIPPYGTAANPVDITAHALEIGGRIHAIDALMRSSSVDAIVLVASLADPGHLEKERGDLARIAGEGRKPLLFYTYTMPSVDNLGALDDAGIACYTTLGGIARGLAALARYAARG